MLRVCVVADAGMISRQVLRKLEAMGGNTSWPGCGGPRKSRSGFWPTRSRSGWSRGRPGRRSGTGRCQEPEPKLEVKEVLVKTNQPDGSVAPTAMWSAATRSRPAGRPPPAPPSSPGSRGCCVTRARDPAQEPVRGPPSQGPEGSLRAQPGRTRRGPEIRRDLGGAHQYRTRPEGCRAALQAVVDGRAAFRTAKSGLDTRPVFHQTDDAIRGHMFCAFLALTLQKALFERLERPSFRKAERHRARPPGRHRPKSNRTTHASPCAAASPKELPASSARSDSGSPPSPTPPPHPTSRHPRLRRTHPRHPEFHRNAVPRTLGTNRNSPHINEFRNQTVKDESDGSHPADWGLRRRGPAGRCADRRSAFQAVPALLPLPRCAVPV